MGSVEVLWVAELLIKAAEQGKKVYIAVLSGTEVVEGGLVSIVNSQQTVFSQFHSRGLFLKDLADLVCFSAPLQHKVPNELRDTATEPVNSIMTDIRYEATITAPESHYLNCTIPVSPQRSYSYKVFKEVYHLSEVQTTLRQSQTWPVKPRVEFNMSSRNPRQAQHLSMDPHRCVRSTTNRYLNDGTPNPTFVVEWAAGFQTDRWITICNKGGIKES